jgi:hypothetical protein
MEDVMIPPTFGNYWFRLVCLYVLWAHVMGYVLCDTNEVFWCSIGSDMGIGML